ncbi:hypothetical protein LDO32_18855 [Luteimonas sp. Y-2-2-4F]|nr:hypothetical protein [Luteimonas sp. Y-2-2-4F]MCD9033776.1 hypothetical protein [Luteimonas sp. Y-2-2-4F]
MRIACIALLCTIASAARGQDAAEADAAASEAAAPVAELAPVRVVAERIEDPFAFRNPIEVEDNVFRRAWREPPSLEEIGMQGGLVNMAVGYALMKTAEGVKRLPGWKDQIQPAEARPPPLDEALRARAAELQDDGAP